MCYFWENAMLLLIYLYIYFRVPSSKSCYDSEPLSSKRGHRFFAGQIYFSCHLFLPRALLASASPYIRNKVNVLYTVSKLHQKKNKYFSEILCWRLFLLPVTASSDTGKYKLIGEPSNTGIFQFQHYRIFNFTNARLKMGKKKVSNLVDTSSTANTLDTSWSNCEKRRCPLCHDGFTLKRSRFFLHTSMSNVCALWYTAHQSWTGFRRSIPYVEIFALKNKDSTRLE